MKEVGSFIKWAGGKGQLLPQFQAFLPQDLRGRGYIEPFMGSAAVFFHMVQTRHPATCTLLDGNPELVNLFVQVRDHLPTLLPLLAAHRDHHNRPGITEDQRKEYYYGIRALQPPPGSLEAAARFLYLNKTCFNGLHRLNRQGKFNVPMGSYAQPAVFDPDHLAAVARLLHDVRIETSDYRNLSDFVNDGDFVYLDPPYEPLSRTSSFTSYAKEDFSADDQRALRDVLQELSPRCHWMLSNSSAPLIEQLYDQPGWHRYRVLATRAINSRAAGRGKVAELVVTNYPVPTSHVVGQSDLFQVE